MEFARGAMKLKDVLGDGIHSRGFNDRKQLDRRSVFSFFRGIDWIHLSRCSWHLRADYFETMRFMVRHVLPNTAPRGVLQTSAGM